MSGVDRSREWYKTLTAVFSAFHFVTPKGLQVSQLSQCLQ